VKLNTEFVLSFSVIMEEINDHEFFKILKDNLPDKSKNSTNIIEFKDGILYAWNRKDSCILTLSIELQLKYSQQYPVQVSLRSCFVKITFTCLIRSSFFVEHNAAAIRRKIRVEFRSIG